MDSTPAHRKAWPGVHLDRAGGHVDRLHGRAAEPVDRGARHIERQIGQETDQARHVQALLALREGAADDQVLDVGGIDAGFFQ